LTEREEILPIKDSASIGINGSPATVATKTNRGGAAGAEKVGEGSITSPTVPVGVGDRPWKREEGRSNGPRGEFEGRGHKRDKGRVGGITNGIRDPFRGVVLTSSTAFDIVSFPSGTEDR
jgi:hypothetical protein